MPPGENAGDTAHPQVTGITSHHHECVWRRIRSTRCRTLRWPEARHPHRLPATHRAAALAGGPAFGALEVVGGRDTRGERLRRQQRHELPGFQAVIAPPPGEKGCTHLVRVSSPVAWMDSGGSRPVIAKGNLRAFQRTNAGPWFSWRRWDEMGANRLCACAMVVTPRDAGVSETLRNRETGAPTPATSRTAAHALARLPRMHSP
ncbi:hypothetical protein MVI01_10220 [Myxococcus virescens]|uniref:Uncharacterized protein n=1 Tax=Myxococcus virescens TaxID=83456 RepID=A0A511H6S2_9BACT|nr:hypothetical protein MVI01_10220 [Myxococcus virescens]